MNKLYSKILVLLVLLMPFTQGCEKQEILMSKDKISKQLSHTWKKLFTPPESNVSWQFEDGIIYIRQNGSLRTQGTYSIDCSVTKVKVKISGLEAGYHLLNVTWQVISLDDVGLVMTDLDKGTQECDFERMD